jgi:hypothetical protein
MENITFENGVIHYLNEMYGDLMEYKTDKYPGGVFFIKDGKVYMEHNLKTNELWVDNYTIFEDLEIVFEINFFEYEVIISKWAEQTYKLKDVITQTAFLYFESWLDINKSTPETHFI